MVDEPEPTTEGASCLLPWRWREIDVLSVPLGHSNLSRGRWDGTKLQQENSDTKKEPTTAVVGGKLKPPSKQDTPPAVTAPSGSSLFEGVLDSVTKPRESVLHGQRGRLCRPPPKTILKSSIPPPSTPTRRRRPLFLFPVVVSLPIATPSPPSLGHACLGHALGASRAERAQRLACCEIPRPFSFPTPAFQPPAILSPAPTLEPAFAFVCRLQAQLVFGNVDRRGSAGLRERRDHETTQQMWPTRRGWYQFGSWAEVWMADARERVWSLQNADRALARTSGRAGSVAQWVGS